MTTEAIEGSDGHFGVPDATRLGRYRLVQQLGEGGMGVVHLALDPSGRAVALKLLRPHIAHDPAARTRLAREVQVLGRIQDRRVAAVIDADLDGPRPYVVTCYVPGPSLDEVVKEHGPVRGEWLARLGRGLADALHVIHEADVIHRDLKPGNVLLVDGEPVLIDFGIAHVADDVRITMTGLVMGTPGYLSPEVVEGAPVTEATDWWGWAATLAFAASGAPPFGRGPMDVVLSRVSRGEADLTGVDPRLAPLLYAALSPDPRQRPDSDEVVDALQRYAAGRPATEVLSGPATTLHTEVMAHRPTEQWDRPTVAPTPLALPVEVEPWADDAPVAYEEPGLLDEWGEQQEVSDWQAAWQGGSGEPDPRIGRPHRSGTLAALLLVLVGLAASLPAVSVAVFLVWSWVARTADRAVTSMVLRRHHRGRRRSDVPLAVVASPWHLAVGALASLVAALLPAVIGVCGVFSAALATVAVTGGRPEPQRALPLAVGMFLGALTAWWGPGGAALRRGSRSIVRGVSPRRGAAQALALTALAVGVGLAVWAYSRQGEPSWWPAANPFDLLPWMSPR